MMEKTRKHLLCLAIIGALSPVLATQSYAQLHLEITKAPEAAPKIAIVQFCRHQSIYPIVETDLTRSGRSSSAATSLPATATLNNPKAEACASGGVPFVVTASSRTTAAGSLEIPYQLYD